MKFDISKNKSSIIKVIGVGGGGGNAVNYMYKQGIVGVDFAICNTDNQALENSPVPVKVALGPSLTEGRGAGSKPEVGRNAAIENIDEFTDSVMGKLNAIRGYANFLYAINRFEDAAKQLESAVLEGDGETENVTNGYTFQLKFANECDIQYYENAMHNFVTI